MSRRPFFHRHALLILMLVCFFVPFGLRGARMGMKEMRNDVKDWLPDRFEETAELAAFREHFKGGAFVIVSWDGCTGEKSDTHFRQFVDQFFPELPPSYRAAARKLEAAEIAASGAVPTAGGKPNHFNEELGVYARQLRRADSERDFIGNRFDFYFDGDFHENWAGLDEKWIRGDGKKWFYIVPNGDIYRWEADETLIAAGARAVRFAATGKRDIKSTLVATPGSWDGPWYYKDPRRLEADLFESLVTGPALLSELTRDGGALPHDKEAAMERLNGVLFGADGKTTCLLATLSDRGRKDIHRIVGRGAMGRVRGRILRMAEQAGLSTPPPPSTVPLFIEPFLAKNEANEALLAQGPEIRMGGPPVDNVAIDEEGQITLARLVGLSMLIGMTLSWINFRSWSVVLMLFFAGVVSAIFSLSIVWWTRSYFDAVMMSMPSLVYVLGLSGAVHIVNYYRDTVDTEGYPGNPGKALAFGWKPCTVAALTTALGLVSLATSDIVPIRKFGFFAAVGVVFTLAILFSFLPAGLSLWPPKNFHTRKTRDGRGLAEYVTAFWRKVGEHTVKNHSMVTAACLVVLAVTAIGLTKINTSVQLLKLFDTENKIIKDYAWLEGNLGKLVPMEVLVRVDPALMRSGEIGDENEVASTVDDKFRLNFLERMEIVETVRRQIDAKFGPASSNNITGTPMLATTFVPPIPARGGGSFAMGKRGAYSRTLAEYREDISESDYFRVDDDQSELWRISLRLGALDDVDYGYFVDNLKEVVEPVMSAYRFRDEVLRRVDAGRNGEGYRGARVLLLGAPFGQSRFASQPIELPSGSPYAKSSDDKQMQVAKTEESGESEVDQQVILAQTLTNLLINAGLNARDWHDPNFELPENLGGNDYDCVILLRDDPRYDMDAINSRTNLVVDTRECAYHPALADADVNPHRTARQQGWPVSASYTGLVPIVYKAQRTLLSSLIQSTIWAFLAISIVMVVLLRSAKAGMVSMLPNVFPVVVIFGMMGWSKILVDIGTMMTASVAMGVAVDDTIHFLTWFRRGLDQGLERKGAIMLAYDRCATAMTQTTLIGGLGLAVFGMSTFMPTQRFGILMLTLMLAALVGDLVFLPAILAGPVGRVFNSNASSDSDDGRRTATQPSAMFRSREEAQISEDADMRIEESHAAQKRRTVREIKSRRESSRDFRR